MKGSTAVGLALGLILGGIGLAQRSVASPISGGLYQVFNNFSNQNDMGSGAFAIYGGNVSFLNSTLSASFTPRLSGCGLLVLNNINHANFANSGGTAVQLSNPTSNPESISFELHDNNNFAQGIQMVLPPNSTNNYVLVNNWASNGASYGMEFLPAPYQGMINIAASGNQNFNWSNVQSVQIYAIGPYSNTEVVNVSNVRLLQPYTMQQLLTGICNQFGQTTLSQPENPISSASDLVNELQSENSQLASGPLNSNVDAYQGSLSLPAQTATGRFRLQMINGKWWFVDPLGHLFFASGIDQISTYCGQTVTGNRQYMFTSLPAAGTPLAANYGSVVQNGESVQTYNFYTSNLQQKFQTSNWQQPWWDMAKSRLLNWGFNSLGSYCDAESSTDHIPYIASLSQRGSYDTISTGNNLWGPIPDPFDPQFKAALTSNINSDDQSVKNDPYCYGMYSGIELSFSGPSGMLHDYGVATGTLAAGPTSPAKQAFYRMLFVEYHRVSRLNAAWGTHFATWNDFLQPFTIQSMASALGVRDLQKFTYGFFEQYFATVHSVIKTFDPNLLDLGTEISTGHYSPYLMLGARGICDAMCMNNTSAVPNAQILGDAAKYNLPVITTEFHFESATSGMFGGTAVLEPDEASRAQAASAYMQDALQNPMMVGANWYRYYDDNITGDLFGVTGGDNFNVGLVDIADTPYSPLISSFKTVHQNMYSTRWNS